MTPCTLTMRQQVALCKSMGGSLLNPDLKDNNPEDERVKRTENIGSRSDTVSSNNDKVEGTSSFDDVNIEQYDEITDMDDETIHVIDEIAYGNEVEGRIHLIPDASKPDGSMYVSIEMKLAATKEYIKADACIDTGADFTVCD